MPFLCCLPGGRRHNLLVLRRWLRRRRPPCGARIPVAALLVSGRLELLVRRHGLMLWLYAASVPIISLLQPVHALVSTRLGLGLV